MALPTLEATVSLNTSKFESGIKKMQAQWKSLTDNMAKLGAASAAAFATMTFAIGKATQAFAAQEAATKKLEIAVSRFAGSDQRLLKQLKQTASELQDLTGIGNETIEAIAGMGLSMGIAGNQIDKATKAAVVLNQVLGMDTTTAMRNLAKTTAGMTGELGEAVPFIRELTTEQLKAGEAIDLIIGKLGNFSQELSNTTDVHIKRLKAALGDIGEEFGKLFAPEVKELADFISNLSKSIAQLSPESQATIKSIVKLGMTFAALGAALGAFALIWKSISFVITTGISIITNPWLLLIAGIATGAAIIIGHWDSMREEASKAFGSMEDNWTGAYDSYADIWANPDVGGLEKLAATVGKFSGEVWRGWKPAWENSYKTYHDIWSNPDLTGIGKLAATFAKFFQDNFTGWQAGWNDSYKSYADVWKDPDTTGIQKLAATFSLSIKQLWHGTGETPGLRDVFSDAWDNLVSVWQNPDLSFWEKVWESMKTAPRTLARAIQSVGATFTGLFGGDAIKYFDNTSKALDRVKERLDSIGKSENVSQMINNVLAAGVEIAQLPAQFVLGGIEFGSDFQKKMTEKLVTAGFIATATGLISGNWQLGVVLGVASIMLGDNALTLDPEKPLWVNIADIGLSLAGGYTALMSVVGVGKWLSGILAAKIGVAGISVALPTLALIIGAIKIGWEVGSFAGDKLVEEGIGDQWHEWMQNTLGDFYTNAIVDLKTDTFLEQLNASGIYVGLTILAGLKWAFDNTFGRLGDWIWNIVKDTALQIYEAGLEIGNQLIDAIKYVFGGGWLLEMLGISTNRTPPVDTSPGRSSGGREGNMPIVGGGGEGLRFKEDQTKTRVDLSKTYAALVSDVTGFLPTGPEISSSPLSLDIREQIDKILEKADTFVAQQQTPPIEESKEPLLVTDDSQKALAGISVDPTNVIAPLIEKVSLDLINGLNMGMIDPLVIAAIAYAENKMGIWATEGAGKGPFQWEYAAFEDISTRWMRDTIPSTMTHTEAATEPTYAIMGSEYYLDWLKNYGEGALGSLTATLVGWNKGRSAAQDWVAEGSNIEDLQDSTKILLTNFMVGMEKFVEGDWAKLSSELFDEILEVAGVVNAIIEQYPDVVKKSFPGEIPYTFDLIDEPVESVQNIAASLDLTPVLDELKDIKNAILSKELSVTVNESPLDLSPVAASIDYATTELLDAVKSFGVESRLEEVKERLDELIRTETETAARSMMETLLESIQTEIASQHETIKLIHARIGTIRDILWKAGYSSGGYTGNVPETAIAGVVHGGEWVAPAWMVEAYPELFGRLENMRQRSSSRATNSVRGYQAGGMVDVVSMNAMFGTTLDTIASLLDAFAPLTDVISLGFNKILDLLLVVVGDNETAKNLIVNLKGLNSEMAITFENSGKTLRDLKEQMESMKTSLEDIEDNTSPMSLAKTYKFPDLAGEFGRKLWQNLNAAEMKNLTGRLGSIGQWALPDWEAQYRESFINQLAGALEIAMSTLQGELTAGAASLIGGGAEAGAAFSMTQGIEALGALGVEGAAAAGAIGLVVIGAGLLFKAFDNLVDVTGSLNRGFEKGISKTVERLQRPLELIGEIVGTAIAPILQILTPLLDGFARAVAWFYNEIYVPIANWFGAGLKKIDIEGKLNYGDDETLATKSYSSGVTGSVTNNITIEIDTYGLVDPEGIKKLYELLGDYADDLELAR